MYTVEYFIKDVFHKDEPPTKALCGGGDGNRQESLDGEATIETWKPSQKWDILNSFSEVDGRLQEKLESQVETKKGVKWQLSIKVKYNRLDKDGNVQETETTFTNNFQALTNPSQINDQLANAFQNVNNQSQEFERQGSGWNLDEVVNVNLNSATYKPLMGSSYIPTPRKLAQNIVL